MGFNTRMLITGDITQIDLPAQPGSQRSRSGLVHALNILHGVPGLAIHRFTEGDIVRHPLVGAIANAYDNAEKSG
jgi:phosphate starvation-inducible PhoH-like protein